MKYCWNCGAQLQSEASKFCSECGTNLTATTTRNLDKPKESQTGSNVQDSVVASKPMTAREMGSTLEDNVAAIFKRMGYGVQVRQRFSTQSGTAEIDIILTRGERKRGVECKNYGQERYVGIKELRDFKGRLEQVGIISGLFVTNTFFSGEAEQYADSNGIETWDRSTLQEKLLAHFTGRDGGRRGLTIDALKVTQPFQAVSALGVKNKDAVRLFTSLLIYHPYYLVKYRVYGTRKDPTGRVHKIIDEGTCIVDAVDQDVVNRKTGISGGIGGLLKSKEERVERKEDKLVSKELLDVYPEKQTPASTSEYELKILEPQVSDSVAWKIARDYAVEKNSRVVHYQPKSSRGDALGILDTKSMQIVPKESEVTRRGVALVHVPKWDLQFESGQMTFQRRSLAYSGALLTDSIAKCEKCSLIHRQTAAVCEICGLPLCDKHAHEEAGALLCEDHISADLRQKLKSNSFVSKLIGKPRG
jgi:Restriction endonuclease/zinc-ribbon domain